MSLIGAALKFVYQLRRHRWLGWPLALWLGLLLAGGAAATLIREWPQPWLGGLLAVGVLAYVLLLGWAVRREFVHFVPDAEAKSEPPTVHAASLLGRGEKVPLRTSGDFAVEGNEQYFVDLEADFETTGTREHMVLARVHPSRFLLFGRWPKFELGWWYAFFQSDMIREVMRGRLYFGARPRQTLRVVYATDQKTQRTIYLTFKDASALHCVWDDLLLDDSVDVAVAGVSAKT